VSDQQTVVGHTPGPWRITDEIDRFHGGEFIRYGGINDAKTGPVAVVCDFNRYDRDDERKANAALIAAAPELLAFLKLLEADDDAPLQWRGRAIDLIAKAEGRS